MIHRITEEAFRELGRIRFGTPNWTRWVFVCPSCGQHQTWRDFALLGKPDHIIMRVLGYSCIGWLRRAKKSNRVVPVGSPTHGHGCEYRGGHAPWLGPKVIMMDGGLERPTFDFAPSCEACGEVVCKCEPTTGVCDECRI